MYLSTTPARRFSINILRLVPQRGISFSLFEQWKEYSQKETAEYSELQHTSETNMASTIYTLALGGALSTAIAGALCYPIDVVRTRVTVQRGAEAPMSASQIVRNVGNFRELYQGFTPTMLKNVPEWGLNFALFEMLRERFVPPRNTKCQEDAQTKSTSLFNNRTLRLLACGAVTSVVSQTLVYPLETIRRNMQIAMWSSSGAPGCVEVKGSTVPSMVETASSIFKRRGAIGFYSGLVPTYLRVVPATASGFMIYHSLLEALR